MTKIAIILSGCGVKDGSEIHEATLTLLAIVKAGAKPLFFAPSGPQSAVVNHLTGDVSSEERNMLIESARIARGNINELSKLSLAEVDAIIFPGGSGAAINLSNFAAKGVDCSVHPQIQSLIGEAHANRKPMGFICIAPALAARVLGDKAIKITCGTDPSVSKIFSNWGAKHEDTNVTEVCVDAENLIVSTPAYMLASNIVECEAGITKLVNQVIRLCN